MVKPPPSIVIIALEEGCQTHGAVTENPEGLSIGEAVEVYFEKAGEDEEGNDLIVDKFGAAGKK